MRIRRIDCKLLHLPLSRPRASPLEAAAGRLNTINVLLVRVDTAEGLRGLGFAYTLQGSGRALYATAVDDLEPLVLGEDALDHERLAAKVYWRLQTIGRRGLVAQAYSAERTLDEAVTTGRLVPIMRAIWHLAVTTVTGFLTAMLVLSGYLFGFTFLVLAALKPIFPDHVGFWTRGGSNGLPTNLQIRFALQPNEHPDGGYWIIPFCLFCGLGLLVASYRGSRGFLKWWRKRHPSRA